MTREPNGTADRDAQGAGSTRDDVARHNRRAWDGLVERANRWTLPVDAAAIAAARRGEWEIVLTPTRSVPRAWFPPLAGERVLLLAGAGGQQAPVLAAAGARVTVLDNSPRQLAQDQLVATREGLEIAGVLGDMRDLSMFADHTFALVVHPCANSFVPDIRPVWREAFRVLRPGGRLAVSDVVCRGEIPSVVRKNMELWVGCVAGALQDDQYRELLVEAGFVEIDIEPTRIYAFEDARAILAGAGLDADVLAREVTGRVMGAFIRARKPA